MRSIVVAVLLTIVWHQRVTALADPAACPGLLEQLSPLALRRFDGLRVGALLAWTNGAIVIAALAAFTRLAHILSGSLICAAAAAAATIATATFDRTLRPTEALAVLGLWSWAGVALAPASADAFRSAAATRQLVAALAIVPLLAPRLFLPAVALAMVTAGGAERRRARLLAMVTAAASVVLLMLRSFTTLAPTGPARLPLAGCVLPAWTSSVSVGEAIATALGDVGPFPVGLAALGIFVAAGPDRSRFGWAAIVWVVAPLFAGGAALTAGVAVFWCLVAIGLGEVLVEGRSSMARRLAASLLLLLLPILQHQRLAGQEPPASTMGQGALTAGRVSSALRALPPVTLVAEDASTDLVLRAVSSSRAVGGRPVRVSPRDAASVAVALGRGPVFAFPRGQRELQHRGVAFVSKPSPAGLAQVDGVQGCSPVDRSWKESPAVVRTSRFALVATRPDARGPLTLYFGSDAPLSASALDWTGREMRGFHPRPYSAADRAELREALISQGVPASSGVLTAPHVLRLVLWRTPAAPAVLPVALSAHPTIAIARLDAASHRDGIELCPSYAFEPATIESR